MPERLPGAIIAETMKERRASHSSSREGYYDPRTGAVGYGRTYGEHSFNGRPVGAEPMVNFLTGPLPILPRPRD